MRAERALYLIDRMNEQHKERNNKAVTKTAYFVQQLPNACLACATTEGVSPEMRRITLKIAVNMRCKKLYKPGLSTHAPVIHLHPFFRHVEI
jgi:hypothetical protein